MYYRCKKITKKIDETMTYYAYLAIKYRFLAENNGRYMVDDLWMGTGSTTWRTTDMEITMLQHYSIKKTLDTVRHTPAITFRTRDSPSDGDDREKLE